MSANFSRLRPTLSVLSVKDRERLKRQIEMDRRRLEGDIVVQTSKHIKEGNPQRMLGKYKQFMDPNVKEDPGEIINRMRKYERALRDGEPPPMTRSEKAKLEKQVLKDKEWLKKTMCPKGLYYMKEVDRNGNVNPDFERAVKAASIERSPQFQVVAQRYKQAMRRLDTQTPDASSIERLRPN